MKATHLRYIFLVIVLIGTGIYAGGLLWEKKLPQDKIIGEAQVGGNFSLLDQDGQTRTQTDLRGKYAIVYFGYTYCPDICPTGLHSLSEALAGLKGKAQRVQPIFITVDPERDTQKELHAFLRQFYPGFWGLTGSQEAIEEAKRAFKVYAAKNPPHSGDTRNYTVDHSSIFYILSPTGEFIGHFTHATPSAEMAKILDKLIGG